MIQEYALDPEVVANWHGLTPGDCLIRGFGYGEGRVVSRYPKHWARCVWDAFNAKHGTALGDIDKTRMTVLIQELEAAQVRPRGRTWDKEKDWLNNAEDENARLPFHTIIACANPRGAKCVTLVADIFGCAPDVWKRSSSKIVDRESESMADSVAVMLRCARTVIFVDPHFRPGERRYRDTLTEFLRLVGRCGQPVTLELHVSAANDSTPELGLFQHECRKHLQDVVPDGLTLTVCRLKGRIPGERLHNRYIMTDIGGVVFATGLDSGESGNTDDVILLGKDSYDRRYRDYLGPDRTFDREATFEIKGKATG